MDTKKVIQIGIGVGIALIAWTLLTSGGKKHREGFGGGHSGGHGGGGGRGGRGGRGGGRGRGGGWGWGNGRWWGRPLGYWYSPWSVYNDIYARCVCDDRYFNDIQAGVAPGVALNKLQDCRTLFGC